LKSIYELARQIDTAEDVITAKETLEQIDRALEDKGKLKRYLGKRLSQHQIDKIVEASQAVDKKVFEIMKGNSDIKALEQIRDRLIKTIEGVK
jgi:ribosomal 50S subunit-associated protein YjgA (DUF615 family)